MDGYSVQEAASVLGVAEGRVWELLARGVLLGTPEGDSMRVFLKAQPGPIAPAGTHDESPRANGNGGSQGATSEASAFRELLTEFRNLTERYGQALLALGESRGEVAGLRSRVDQLEARLDLRLPPPFDVAPAAWDSLSVPASAPDISPATPPRVKPRKPVRRKPPPRKTRTSREAVAGFADALARAQDPNAADLGEARAASEAISDESTEPAVATVDAPDGQEQEALAVATEEAPAEELAAEVLVPEPFAAAPEIVEEAPPAEESTDEVEPPTYSAVVVEPDWFADGDFAWLDAAEMEGSAQAGPARATPNTSELEPEPAAAELEAQTAKPEPEPQVLQEQEIPVEPEAHIAEPEPQPEALQEPEMAAEPAREPEPKPQVLQEQESPAEPEVEFEPWQPPEPAFAQTPAEPEVADAPDQPTASTAVAVEEIEEEVMWLGREPEPSPIVPDEPRAEYRAEADGWPAVDAAPAMEVPRPPLAMTEDELARLALDEGWDESEVAAIRAMITPLPSSTVDLPGAAELHEAMAALEAVPVQVDPVYDGSRQWAKQAPDDAEPARHDDWAFEAEPAPPPPAPTRPPSDVTSALRRALEDPGWLRRRQGPAAEAYRRLRRLFPG
jgi:hypothetical protein